MSGPDSADIHTENDSLIHLYIKLFGGFDTKVGKFKVITN